MSDAFAFWHPFGPHGNESAEAILARKRDEIAANGWTLWSFQHRRMLGAWHDALSAAGAGRVVALCSASKGAKDPAAAGGVKTCRSYRLLGEERWRTFPDAVKVPHPFRRGARLASAFVVADVLNVSSGAASPVSWYHRSGVWRSDRVPTRGEFLLKVGEGASTRGVRALLVLKRPWLAVVSSLSVEEHAADG